MIPDIDIYVVGMGSQARCSPRLFEKFVRIDSTLHSSTHLTANNLVLH
jgi:hypothetical protein